MTQLMKDILKLSIPDRILMVEAIWDSITKSKQDIPLTEDIKNLLDKRLDAHNAKPDEGSSWEEVKARIIEKI